MSIYGHRGSFLGFTYNGIHSSTLGITRVSNSRYNEDLLPTLKDVTTDIVGATGKTYFGTTYTKREISVPFVFEGLSDLQLRQMYELWEGKHIHDLIFDEYPYKIYSAKITGNSAIKHVAFEDGKNTIYRGEGTVKFTCYFPFARSRFNWQEEYNLDNIPEWRSDDDFRGNSQTHIYGNLYYDFDSEQDAIGECDGEEGEFIWVNPQSLLIDAGSQEDNITNNGSVILTSWEDSLYINYNEWIESSQIPSRQNYGTYDESAHRIFLFNAGDIGMPSQWWFKVPDDSTDYNLSYVNPDSTLTGLTLTGLIKNHIESPTGAGADKYFVIDMVDNSIQGYDEYFRPTGRLYNHFITSGQFFAIPQGRQQINCNVKPYDIKFNYLYL